MIELIVSILKYVFFEKKLFLLPILIVSTLLGILLIFLSGSVVGPFIYTLF